MSETPLVRDTDRNAQRFFASLREGRDTLGFQVLVVMHLVPGARLFFEHLNQVAEIAAILPKPKSIDPNESAYLSGRYRILSLTREGTADAKRFLKSLKGVIGEKDRFAIIDIGGYFADICNKLVKLSEERLVGIVEDTENGHKRYAAIKDLRVPVVSVARSELKNSEDFLVGQSIVFSAERLMRDFGSIMNGRRATVIGYGKIGRSVAHHLRSRHLSTFVVETDPIRSIEAKAHGFHVIPQGLALSRGNLVFCATGNTSLGLHDFEALNNGSYVISVTSADDEMDVSSLRKSFEISRVSPHIEKCSRDGQFFYLVAGGNAVNFAIDDRARLGPFIYPVQAELGEACRHLESLADGLHELPVDEKRRIALCWEEAFSTVNRL